MLDSIKQAISRAKTSDGLTRQLTSQPGLVDDGGKNHRPAAFRLNVQHLERMRVVVPSGNALTSRYYDMLRTQLLQEMEKSGLQILAITSPTPECGKTVTACNLAMSIARLPERSAMIVDLDLHKAKVAPYLGIEPRTNVVDVLENRASLNSSLVRAQFGPDEIVVLPGLESTAAAAAWMDSHTMANLLQAIRREFRSSIVILDLPPLLHGSDVLSILPLVDAVLLVTCVGTSTLDQIKECQKHLRKSNVLRVVVNMVSESSDAGYGYNYK